VRSPAFQLILAIYLALGLTGAGTALAELTHADGDDCCSDCDDPACPEERGESCPPQCDDCVCPCWVAPFDGVTVSLDLDPRPLDRPFARFAEITREPPPPRGVFRPPRV
jgi:hypothetical protein